MMSGQLLWRPEHDAWRSGPDRGCIAAAAASLATEAPRDDYADYLELREWCGKYCGVNPDALSDEDVQRFASLTGCGVRE